MSLASIGIGVSDFRKIREKKLLYVDKTHLISRIVEDGAEILLFSRPRRFGKTLSMTTLQAFFERKHVGHEDLTHLFDGLSVWNDTKSRAHFQKHPVIFLSLKDVKQATWEECFTNMRRLLKEIVQAHAVLKDSELLSEGQRGDINALISGNAPRDLVERSLRVLSELLHQVTGEQAVILIDEYDTPIHESYVYGYYDESIQFFRNFLSAGLKDNPHVYKGVLTGILRVAREGMFSGLNNIMAHSLLSYEYSDCFGFTDEEVVRLTKDAGLGSLITEIRAWYNGYLFGETVMYNPFSILHFLNDKQHLFRPYWVNSGSPDLLVKLIPSAGVEFLQNLEVLLQGKTLEKRIDENLVLRDLGYDSDALWNLMLFSGYLKPAAINVVDGKFYVNLAIPNREIHTGYEEIFKGWVKQLWGSTDAVLSMLKHMLKGEVKPFETMMQKLVQNHLSYHDTGKKPEQTYHAFTLGMLVLLYDTHHVKSNPESGYGRADVLIIPKQKNQPGAVLEFKSLEDDEDKEQAFDAALKQIDEQHYVNELEEAGAMPIQKYALVFQQKHVWVKKGTPSQVPN